MTSERRSQLAVPLDADGFMRRLCHSCDRLFKDLVSQDEDEIVPAPSGGYYCPYCGLQSDQWLTPEQLTRILGLLSGDVIEPELQQFRRDLERASTDPVRFSVAIRLSDVPSNELTEPNDMRRVDFTCHPEAPIKVLDEWHRPVYCRVCGVAPSTGAS